MTAAGTPTIVAAETAGALAGFDDFEKSSVRPDASNSFNVSSLGGVTRSRLRSLSVPPTLFGSITVGPFANTSPVMNHTSAVSVRLLQISIFGTDPVDRISAGTATNQDCNSVHFPCRGQ